MAWLLCDIPCLLPLLHVAGQVPAYSLYTLGKYNVFAQPIWNATILMPVTTFCKLLLRTAHEFFTNGKREIMEIMLLCKIAPLKRRKKPKEPKKGNKDGYASIFVHVPTQMHICVCAYFHFKCKVGLIFANIGQQKHNSIWKVMLCSHINVWRRVGSSHSMTRLILRQKYKINPTNSNSIFLPLSHTIVSGFVFYNL